ncbi:MAG: hypothetical protein ABII82_07475 [Verrucomicrobiota bacterium]
MKLKYITFAMAALCATASLHAEKIVAGPKGGRLLETEPLKAEFFVTAERKVEVTFYDAALKPIDPGAQTVTVTAEPASGKTKLELEKTATGFVSKTALPAGEPYRVVVQARASADAKPKNFRVDLNLATCGECQKAEYACVCDSH